MTKIFEGDYPLSFQFEDPGKYLSQKLCILNSRQFMNPGSVGVEKKQSDPSTVIHFRKNSPLLGCKIGDQKSDPVIEFRFERVDHSLQLTAGSSTRVMNLNHYIRSLSNQSKVVIFTRTFPEEPNRDDDHENAGDGTEPADLISSPGF